MLSKKVILTLNQMLAMEIVIILFDVSTYPLQSHQNDKAYGVHVWSGIGVDSLVIQDHSLLTQVL